MKRLVLIIILQLQFLTLLVAQATYTWNGSADDNVNNSLNWTPNWGTPDFNPLMNNLVIPLTANDPVFDACNIGGTTSGSITVQTSAIAVFTTSLIVGYSGTGIIINNGDISLFYCPLTVGYYEGSSGTIDNFGSIGVVGNSSSVYLGGIADYATGLIRNYGQSTFRALTIGGTGGPDATGTLTNSSTGSFNSTNTTINTTGSLIINSSAKGTISGTLTNNGILYLNSTSSGIFSLIFGSYSGSGTVNTQLYLTGGGSPNYNWHYIAVPFTGGFGKAVFTNESTNLLGYLDSRVISNEFEGWLWHDGVAMNGLASGTPFTLLVYGKGYNYYTPNSSTTITLTRTGYPIGSSLATVNTVYSGGTPGLTQFGYNLLGNSLTCSIDWDNVTFSGSVGQIVYYTTGNKWATYLKGSGGTDGGARYIPPLQGFFVKANAPGASVIFGANVKVHSTQARYKKSLDSQEEINSDVIYPKVKLELTGNMTADETIVWFNENATADYDEKYDGFKLFPSDASVGQLYSILNGNQFVINGIPLPSSSLTVPLGINIPQSGSYSLDKKVLEELDNYNVYLVDKTNGNYTVDIKKVDSYKFSSDAGTFTDRFVLKFESILTSVETPSFINKKFNIYGTKDFINILPSDDFGKESIVKIYDLTGRIVKQANISGFYKGSLLQIPFGGYQGIIIVEISSGSLRYNEKVFVH